MPDADDPAKLGWWQPEVRAHICVLALADGLEFVLDNGDVERPRLAMNYVSRNAIDLTGLNLDAAQINALSALRAAQLHPIVDIQRPKRNVIDVQLAKVIAHANEQLRRSRAIEAMAQMLPQVPFWASVVPLSPWRTPNTYEFVGIALKFANEVCHRFKHSLAVPRPSELSPLVQPILQTPGWAALPSGHATEAFMFSRLIISLLGQQPDNNSQLWRTLEMQAASIADNRVYAGLHYPVDGVAGRLLGNALAQYVVAACTGTAWLPRRFVASDGAAENALKGVDLDIHVAFDGAAYFGEDAAQKRAPNPILAEMWRRARVELAGLGFGTVGP